MRAVELGAREYTVEFIRVDDEDDSKAMKFGYRILKETTREELEKMQGGEAEEEPE